MSSDDAQAQGTLIGSRKRTTHVLPDDCHMMIESQYNFEDCEAKISSDVIENLLKKKWNTRREAKDEVISHNNIKN